MKTFLILLLFVFPAYAQRQYDAAGTYLGTIKQEGSRLVERDASGGIVGYWITAGGTTSHYDRGGSLLGRSRP
jgi:20S proteasome alpha/beta subunit